MSTITAAPSYVPGCDMDEFLARVEQIDRQLLTREHQSVSIGPDEWSRSLEKYEAILSIADAPDEYIHRIQLLRAVREHISRIPSTPSLDQDQARARWDAFEAEQQDHGIDRVVLIGGGQYTRRLLSTGWPSAQELRVMCIVDEYPRVETIEGIPVVTPDELDAYVRPGTVAAVSSDTHSELLMRRAKEMPALSGCELFAPNDNTDAQASPTEISTPSNDEHSGHILRCTLSELEHRPEHRTALGLERERSWIDTFCERYGCPSRSSAYMNQLDAAFTWDIIEAAAQSHDGSLSVVEIGTASGVSASFIAHGLDVLYPDSWHVHTFDRNDRCFFDAQLPIGAAVRDLAPELTDQITINTSSNAALAATRFTPAQVGLANIDADHTHPAPALDLLALLPVLAPNAWVILHDIELQAIVDDPTAPPLNDVGPKLLFEAWEHEKARAISGDIQASNTGGIRMPEDPMSVREMLIDLINQRI